MQVMQNISIGLLMCICLIGYNANAASLSMLLPDYRNLQTHLTENVHQINYSKRRNDIQTKEDQVVLELKKLKPSIDEIKTIEKSREKIAAFENQLATPVMNADQDETLQLTKGEKEFDTNIKSSLPKDTHVETANKNDNSNTNEDRAAQLKQYHGAARLAFGQNPEIVSSPSIATSTPTSAQTPVPTEIAVHSSEAPIDRSSSGVGRESIPAEITNNSERRSGNMNGAKNAEFLFKFSDGKYSTLDMAQYVFWTGDEEGVAKAVEEFIRRGLMSRENAIKFLRDISMGIDYLENAYSSNRQVDPIEDNSIQGYSQTLAMMTTTMTTTTSTTEKPIILVEKSLMTPTGENPLPLMQHNGISNSKEVKGDALNSDDMSSRMRLVDFLYTEYSLEEVIYQLAKVMFTQSLSKGSEEAQIALQRLTTFLETEGSRNRISPALQKKILDVILLALSDCLVENPQLTAAAKLNLRDSSIQIPKQAEKH